LSHPIEYLVSWGIIPGSIVVHVEVESGSRSENAGFNMTVAPEVKFVQVKSVIDIDLVFAPLAGTMLVMVGDAAQAMLIISTKHTIIK
jgi:hypothetical protein